jgi:hypothetical protein
MGFSKGDFPKGPIKIREKFEQNWTIWRSTANRVLTGRGQTFPDEPIRVRAEILFGTVSQRTDFDNSDGDRRPFCLAE